ncbi:MAG: ABC transporter permease subunit [Clostridia bacterium]|nr:ABC transporter permease subunit [Clostridia bacterium]
MGAIFRKELRGYFTGITGYILTAIMLFMIGYYTVSYCFSYHYAVFEYVYASAVLVLLFFVPVITMRLFAEEKKQKTDRLLYSLPLKMSDIVLGKYFAALCVLALPCAVSAIYPLLLHSYGNFNFRLIYITLACFFLLGAALTAICMFISLLTENQIAAAIISFVILLLNHFLNNILGVVPASVTAYTIITVVAIAIIGLLVWLVTKNGILADIVSIILLAALIAVRIIKPTIIEKVAGGILDKILLFDVFYIMVDGMLELSTVVLYMSVVVLFTFMSIQVLERRRWA